MKYTKVRELPPLMLPSDKFTLEEAMEAGAKTEAELKARRASKRKRVRPASPAAASETEDNSPPMRMRTLQPPHPGASFTVEEAMQALARVEAAEKALRASRRKRGRSAAQGGGSGDEESGKGDEGS